MTGRPRASDPPPKRAIHAALSSGLGAEGGGAPRSAEIPALLLFGVHLTQTLIGGVFCWICLRAYQAELSGALSAHWPLCLALLALAWVAALPILARLHGFSIALGRRLNWWAVYLLGLLGPLIVVLVLSLISFLLWRKAKAVGKGFRAEASLSIGVVTTWPIMQVAAYLACARALPMKLVEEDALSPYWSVVCAYGICLAVPLALVAVALRVRRARLLHAAGASSLVAGTSVLMPGEAVVWGTVELAEGQERAVRLEVGQDGSEAESSGTWSHTWTETNRRLTVHPFYLKTPGGERVRVLAGDDPLLMDALDGKILVNRTRRTCVAELTPRERVTAFGELVRARDPEAAPGGGYRSGAIGWVLQPPAGGRMLLSSFPIDRPFSESARRIKRRVVLLLAAVAVSQCFLLGYHFRVLFGQPIEGRVTQANRVERETDDGTTIEHHVTIALPAALARTAAERALSREVTLESYAKAELGRAVGVLRDPVLGTLQFGEHPTASIWSAVLATLGAVLCLWLGVSDRPDPKWYSKAQLVDQGSGRLPEPADRSSMSEIRDLVDEALGRKS